MQVTICKGDSETWRQRVNEKDIKRNALAGQREEKVKVNLWPENKEQGIVLVTDWEK